PGDAFPPSNRLFPQPLQTRSAAKGAPANPKSPKTTGSPGFCRQHRARGAARISPALQRWETVPKDRPESRRDGAAPAIGFPPEKLPRLERARLQPRHKGPKMAGAFAPGDAFPPANRFFPQPLSD